MSQSVVLEFEQVGLEGITKEAEAAAKSINTLQNKSNDLGKAFKGALPNIKGLGTQLKSGIGSGVKSATSAFSGMTKTVAASAKSMVAALGPIGIALAAVTAAVQVVKKSFETISQVKGIAMADDVKQLGESFKKTTEVVKKLFVAFASPAISAFSKGLTKILDLLRSPAVVDKFAKAIGVVHTAFEICWGVIMEVYTALKDSLMPVFESAGNTFNKVKDMVMQLEERFGILRKTIGLVTSTWDYIMNRFKDGLKVIQLLLQGDFVGAFEAAGDYAKGFVTGIGESFTDIEKKGADAMNSIADKFKKNTDKANNDIKAMTFKKDEDIAGSSEKTLAKQLEHLKAYIDFEKAVVNATVKDEVEKQAKLKALDQSYYSQKLSLENSAMKTIIENNGKIVDKSITSQEDLKKQIEATTIALQGFNEEGLNIDDVTQKVDNLHQHLTSMTNSLSGLGSSVMGMWSNIVQSATVDLREYERAIEEAQAKYDAMMEEYNAKVAAIEEERKQEEADERELKIQNLEEEMQRSIEANDTMSAKAIKIKLDQLKKEKKADEDKAKQDEELANEKARIEAEGQYAVALATYNKDMATWDANVKKAEQQKNAAIADTALQTATAIANAAMMPLQPGWAAMGPIGIAAASVAAAASLGAALSSIGGIASAANNLESVKSEQPVAPTPPSFAYGTGGYKLGSEYAIVGEAGPELVRNKGNGNLEVVSAENSKGRVGGDVFNLTVNVNEMVTEEQVIGFVRNMKSRNLSFAV